MANLTPIPNPGRPHGTAKARITFDGTGAAGTVYLWTDLPPAGKGWLYPGHAWAGGQVTIQRNPAAAPGPSASTHPPHRADWPAFTRRALDNAGYPAGFAGGRIEVQANPVHGTGTASARFDGPETLLAAIEDAFAAAGWTLHGTADAPAEPAWLAVAAGPDAPAEEPGLDVLAALAGAESDVAALLRDLAALITARLGPAPEQGARDVTAELLAGVTSQGDSRG